MTKTKKREHKMKIRRGQKDNDRQGQAQKLRQGQGQAQNFRQGQPRIATVDPAGRGKKQRRDQKKDTHSRKAIVKTPILEKPQ